MQAGIYCRKSRQQDGTESESVARQEQGGRSFCEQKEWTVTGVYTDDGVSGALFESREEFQRMLRDAEVGVFQALVLFDLDRFGRHAHKTMVALNQLADVGVAVWDYSKDKAIDLDTFEGETMVFLNARFAQQFRDQIRKHTRSAMELKAKNGWVTGGKVFGYINVRVEKGHTELEIFEEEAKVVVLIYEMYADGLGAKAIAGYLNKKGIPKPRAQQGRKDGWSVSTIRAVLERPLYRGIKRWGRTKKAYGRELGHGGKEKGQILRPEKEWMHIEVPDLRIVPQELADRVDKIREAKKRRYHAKEPNFPKHAGGKYLLSGGMLKCPDCNGNFEVEKKPWRGESFYVCATRRRKPGVCCNLLELPVEQTDNEILSIVEGEVLGTRLVKEALELVQQGPVPEDNLEAEKLRLRAEIDNMVRSIASGVPPDSLAPVIREKEDEIKRIEAKLATPRPVRVDLERLKSALEQRSAEWKRDLRKETQVARMVLRRIIGPILLWHEPAPPWVVEWRAKTTPEQTLNGLYKGVVSPGGVEPPSSP